MPIIDVTVQNKIYQLDLDSPIVKLLPVIVNGEQYELRIGSSQGNEMPAATGALARAGEMWPVYKKPVKAAWHASRRAE